MAWLHSPARLGNPLQHEISPFYRAYLPVITFRLSPAGHSSR
jgi:transposase